MTNRQTYQTLEGFGACFNELGYDALMSLSNSTASSDTMDSVLKALFHPDEMGLVYNRVPVGANDYADGWYSHDEMPQGQQDLDMTHFAVTRDESRIIPYIQAAQKYMNLSTAKQHLFASAWSPPMWMKQNQNYSGCNATGQSCQNDPYCQNSLIQSKEVQGAYAHYLSKFVTAYAEYGIDVTAVMVQNEPYASGCDYPKCEWTGKQLRDFIKLYAGPRFEADFPPTPGKDENDRPKIWLGTLNTDDFLECPNTVLSDPGVRKYVGGIAMQWAGKNAVQRVHDTWPEIPIIQSENECGDGSNTWDYAIYIWDLMVHYLENGVRGYTYWNPVLDGNSRGVSHWGWHQNAMISIMDGVSAGADRVVRFNPEFYVFKHFSQTARPGSVRMGTSGDWAGSSHAFKNTNGDVAVLAMNPHDEARVFNFITPVSTLNSDAVTTATATATSDGEVSIASEVFSFSVTLPARSFNSFDVKGL
jgi:glucosylceramidase